MSFTKYLYIFLFSFVYNSVSAQSIQVSICLQHAKTLQNVLGASVLIQELDNNNVIMNVASMYSAIFTPTNLEIGHRYQIKIEKKGFYPIDTIIVPQVTSTSNKQRLGLLMYPTICYQVTGTVIDATSSEKIETGKIIFKDVHANETLEVEINNGHFEFCGIVGHHYHLTTQIEGHLTKSEKIALFKEYSDLHLNLEVIRNYDQSFFQGDSMIVHGLTFVDNSTALSMQGEREMKKLIHILKTMPDVMITVSVHTEVFPELHFNRKLAEQRARAIDHYLDRAGISPHRYLLVCFGKVGSSPEANNSQRVCLKIRK